MIGKIHSIESFGTVDGPGTRFVVFLKGCNLRCQYCHNPDTWKMHGAIEMTAEEIIAKYMKVAEFVQGGITVTGGDPLLQMEFLIELLTLAKENNIHTAVDTSGGVFNPKSPRFMEQMGRLIQVTDLFLLDIKHIDNEEHIKLTGISNKPVLAFARYLSENDIDVWIRHVIIETITLNDQYLYQLGLFLRELNNIKGLEILPYHTMAIPKYEQLGMKYPLLGIKPTSKEQAKRARKIILYAMKGE